MLVPETSATGIGSAIFAMLAAGAVNSIEEAQAKVSPKTREFVPRAENREVYDRLYDVFRRVYFDFGTPGKDSAFGDVLPTLIEVAHG